jgi:hypothetical protein
MTVRQDSRAGKALLAKMGEVKVGDKREFTGFIEGFDEPVIGHCVEIEAGKFWQFALFWNSVFLQDVVIEKHVNGEDVVIDVLGD